MPLLRRKPGTGTIVSRADGRYAARLPPDLNPERRTRYFRSYEDAAAWLDAEVARLRRPAGTLGELGPHEPLGDYLVRWYERNAPDWPERTRLAYLRSLGRWAVIGHVPLGQLTRRVIEDALAALRRETWQRTRRDGTPTTEPRPYSARTLAQARAVLHNALEDAADILPQNPARLRRRRGPRVETPEAPVWTLENTTAFLAAAERVAPHFALAFRLILWRGLRVGEVIALAWDDVGATSLRIDETAGIRGEESGPTKTRRIRDVPLSADLLSRLRAHRRDYPSTSRYVFVLGGKRADRETIRREWNRAIRVAGVPVLAMKDGRATCATLLLDAGWPLPQVAALLGHATIQTTSAHYARAIRRREREVAAMGEALDRTFSGEYDLPTTRQDGQGEPG